MRTRQFAAEGVNAAPFAASVETEVWKDIPGYEGRYQVSNLGRIKSLLNQRILTPKRCGAGYQGITLSLAGTKKRFYIHRLVALCFLPKTKPDEDEINHKDLNKTNNKVSNLEWSTRKANFEHAYKNGRVNFLRIKRQDNKSGKPGVCAHFGGYQVTISYNRKRIYLGWYKSMADAIEARNNAETRFQMHEKY